MLGRQAHGPAWAGGGPGRGLGAKSPEPTRWVTGELCPLQPGLRPVAGPSESVWVPRGRSGGAVSPWAWPSRPGSVPLARSRGSWCHPGSSGEAGRQVQRGPGQLQVWEGAGRGRVTGLGRGPCSTRCPRACPLARRPGSRPPPPWEPSLRGPRRSWWRAGPCPTTPRTTPRRRTPKRRMGSPASAPCRWWAAAVRLRGAGGSGTGGVGARRAAAARGDSERRVYVVRGPAAWAWSPLGGRGPGLARRSALPQGCSPGR